MPAPIDWARAALHSLLLQTALKLVARRERERVEAERWLRELREVSRERAEREGRREP